MSTDDKKTNPASKNGDVEKKAAAAKKDEGEPKDKTTPDADREKAADSPTGYSRGEGQKPVSKAYRDNWNAIFGNKKKKKR